MRCLLAVLGMIAGIAAPALGQDYTFLGKASFSYNDALFDGDDRWQTRGVSYSVLVGPDGTQGLPGAPGTLMELRLRGQVISPDEFEAPAAWDRRAASVLTTTLHSHFRTDGYEMSAGAGVALTGPRIPLIELQEMINDLTQSDAAVMPASVKAAQIPNGIYPTVIGEAARRFELGEYAQLRPFVEAQMGVETYLRAGADVFFGGTWDDGILVRDGTTGFAYQTLKSAISPGLSFTVGADAAAVASSALLPGPDYALTPVRLRARAGLFYKLGRASVFGGVTWLGREFTAQPEGQTVTALKLKWDF